MSSIILLLFALTISYLKDAKRTEKALLISYRSFIVLGAQFVRHGWPDRARPRPNLSPGVASPIQCAWHNRVLMERFVPMDALATHSVSSARLSFLATPK